MGCLRPAVLPAAVASEARPGAPLACSALPPFAPHPPALLQAMTVVLAHAAYLPSAQCFALLPLVGGFRRTGSASGAVLDYDLERQAVTLVAQMPYRCGSRGLWSVLWWGWVRVHGCGCPPASWDAGGWLGMLAAPSCPSSAVHMSAEMRLLALAFTSLLMYCLLPQRGPGGVHL